MAENDQLPRCPICEKPLHETKVPAEETFGGGRIVKTVWVCPEHGPIPTSGSFRA